ncbi:methyl-accepting chemotaxis protein, partial [Noviherbaspirillum sp. CPCC 100848]|nr:methyl-accepting chemotaxis protein [Noviherbaspirillum sp. CPCC 100848]
VTSVKHVADIMNEITAASQEQSSGIEQVNRAIAEMDEMTQQNAALVEQAAAAADSMQNQAAALAQAVAVFRLNASEQAALPPAVAPVLQPVAPAPARQMSRVLAKPKAEGGASSRPPASVAVRSKPASAPGGNDEWEEF